MLKDKNLDGHKRLTPRHFLNQKSIIFIVIIGLGIALVLWRIDQALEADSFCVPSYKQIDIDQIINQKTWSEEDYRVIYHQTGLGKPAADALRWQAREEQLQAILAGTEKPNQPIDNGLAKFLAYQSHLFYDVEISCEKIGMMTYEEKSQPDVAAMQQGSTSEDHAIEFADLQEGDIFLTKSGHTIGWRHGHAALVVDAKQGLALEAVILGSNSKLRDIEHWKTYPSFIQLRLKDEYYTSNIGKQLSWYSLTYLNDIPYGLLTNVTMKRQGEEIRKTQCAYQIWAAYEKYGFDVDSNGGILVVPKDIVASPYLQVVQAYGVDLDRLW